MCVKTILAQSLLAITLLGFLSSSAAADTAADDTTRPNIVFIFADDWGWGDLSCH